MISKVVEDILNGKSIRESLLKESFKGSGNRLDYEDQIVQVFDSDGNEIYSGMEDYEPMKNEDWQWDQSIGAYRLGDYIKNVLD